MRVLFGCRFTTALCVGLLLPCLSAHAWDSRRLAVPLLIEHHEIPYAEFSIFAMPGAHLRVAIAAEGARAEYRFGEDSGNLGEATLVAPAEPGLSILEILNVDTGESARINVFTMVPASQVTADGRLNGYRIGQYPEQPLRNLAIYRPPQGFVEVTEDNADTRVSPNFTLRQFLSKQESGFPKYLVLRPVLLLKLEKILAALNENGVKANGLVIMSGYRTPFYNKLIGNVTYSRHAWGGAADFYVDQSPRDAQMDDLNDDGRIDKADAEWLADFLDDMTRSGDFGRNVGGIGVYDRTAAHGPFVHVDARGMAVRW